MNCPHDNNPNVLCSVCTARIWRLAAVAKELASCTHRRARPMLESPHVWCPDCGSFRLAEQPGVWAIPRSVEKALDQAPAVAGPVGEASADDSGEKNVN